MSEQTYQVAEVFHSIQGEGAMTGEPMAFIRLAGCSLNCPRCDTDHAAKREMSAQEIAGEARGKMWAWITGGEPLEQDLRDLIQALWGNGQMIAIATNGMHPISVSADWISVSPHAPDSNRVAYGSELKICPMGYPLAELTKQRGDFRERFVQPVWGDTDSLRECIDWVMTHRDWRLSLQAHKYIGMP